MRMREREGVIFDQSFRGRVVKEKSESEFDVSGESKYSPEFQKCSVYLHFH